jgi:hypothetical protein
MGVLSALRLSDAVRVAPTGEARLYVKLTGAAWAHVDARQFEGLHDSHVRREQAYPPGGDRARSGREEDVVGITGSLVIVRRHGTR